MNLVDFGMCNCSDAVGHAAKTMPDKQAMDHVSELFKLCGDPTRVGILCALSRHELCVSDIAEVLGMTSSAVSHQLRLLKQTGIVRSHREGKAVLYSIADRHVERIFELALQHAEDR